MRADKATKPPLLSGLAVPAEAERVLKQVLCATRYFEGDSKEGLDQLTALLREFNINTKAKKLKSNAMHAG